MSTRCNVVIKGQYEGQIILYRHCDGYPEGVAPTLDRFCEWVKQGKIRQSAGQSAGWLILLGIQEYASDAPYVELMDLEPETGGMMGWKIGSYEPTDGIHGDIDYIHVVDLMSATWKSYRVDYDTIDDLVQKIGVN